MKEFSFKADSFPLNLIEPIALSLLIISFIYCLLKSITRVDLTVVTVNKDAFLSTQHQGPASVLMIILYRTISDRADLVSHYV